MHLFRSEFNIPEVGFIFNRYLIFDVENFVILYVYLKLTVINFI